MLVSELSWRLVIDLLVPFKIKGLKTAHGKSAIISTMKRTLDTTISRSKNEGSDKRHMPLFRVFPFKSLIVILERGL